MCRENSLPKALLHAPLHALALLVLVGLLASQPVLAADIAVNDNTFSALNTAFTNVGANEKITYSGAGTIFGNTFGDNGGTINVRTTANIKGGGLIGTYASTASASAAPNYEAEYYNSRLALDIINAKEAYKQGYTGKGISVGVIDEMLRIDHPEFLGKTTTLPAYLEDGSLFIPDWSQNPHGSHVGGIIAAKRDGKGMHGVAYDAVLHGATFLAGFQEPTESTNLFFSVDEFFAGKPDMRIVNNSWGGDGSENYIYNATEDVPDEHTREEIFNLENTNSLEFDLMEYALANPQTVFVFAAGNDGMNSSTLNALLPRYQGSDLSNWLNVGSLDSSTIARDPTTRELVLTEASVSHFSNLAGGMELWTVYAPGSRINSLDASTNGYIPYSGTSMAAPVVSGALALVEQAYPWMTGKQLADAVLSTANTSFDAPEYIVTFSDPDGNGDYKFFIYYIDHSSTPSPTKDEVKGMVQGAYFKNPTDWNITEEELVSFIDDGKYSIENLTKEQVFGQGILDVGKAVQGIARLDANRMTKEDVEEVTELSKKSFALEEFDTQGYSAVFNNDIEQRKWDDKYHHDDFQSTVTNSVGAALDGMDIGIIKSGAGELALLGKNTYEGATLIEGGTLSISKRTNGTGGELLHSDVIVRAKGTLAGNGTITNQVINQGTLELRTANTMASAIAQRAVYTENNTLTVGTYKQNAEGIMHVDFDSAGNHGTLKVTKEATLAGKIVFDPAKDYYSSNEMLTFNVIDGTVIKNFDSSAVLNDSLTLAMNLAKPATPDKFTLQISREHNAYSQHATNDTGRSIGNAMLYVANAATGDMQTLFSAVDFTKNVGEALTKLSPEAYSMTEQSSLRQQNTTNLLLMGRLLSSIHAQNAKTQQNTDAKNVQTNAIDSAEESFDATAKSAGAADTKTGLTTIPSWQAWATTFGAFSDQNVQNTSLDFDNRSIGLVVGMDTSFNTGAQFGFHAIASTRKTQTQGTHDANADTETLHIGVQGLYRPNNWDGFYLAGQTRVGLENNTMQRTISIGDYIRRNESSWTDFTGSATLNVGKNWTVGPVIFGPLAWLEYSFVNRPEITESGGGATSLKIESDMYHSLALPIGAHIGTKWNINEKNTMALNLLVAWRHELLSDSLNTRSSFVGYEGMGFTSSSSRVGQDTFLLQGSIRFMQGTNFFLQGDVGGEFSAGNTASGANINLSIGYSF